MVLEVGVSRESMFESILHKKTNIGCRMNTTSLLSYWLESVTPRMHKGRLKSLSTMVTSSLGSGRLTVTSLGRSILNQVGTKHNIKRADRLLSNKHLHSELEEIYSHLTKASIGSTKNPVILIDWSDIGVRNELFLLRASVAIKGRPVTLYEEVHTLATKEKVKTHKAFLKKLKEFLPDDCTPILVTDAGFRNTWFRLVKAIGWNYVGRVRGTVKVQQNGVEEWIPCREFMKKARSKPKALGLGKVAESNPEECFFTLYKGKKKGRKKRTKYGKRCESSKSKRYAYRGREPWLLVCSLNLTAQQMVDIYATRMQIEESFRDLKSVRFGLSFALSATHKIKRMKVLICIGTLATTFATILGKAGKILEINRSFQANSVKEDVILSNSFLGMQLFRAKGLRIFRTQFRQAIQQLQVNIRIYEPLQ